MYDFLDYRVEDAMTEDPITIAPEATLAEAQALFEAHDFNALPVVEGTGRLIGVLTKLDILRAFRFDEQSMFPPYDEVMRRTVRESLREGVDTVTRLTPLTRVLEQLVASGHKSLVVTDRGQPVGMIAREDVLTALRRATGGERGSEP